MGWQLSDLTHKINQQIWTREDPLALPAPLCPELPGPAAKRLQMQ